MEMRKVYAETMATLMRNDEKIIILDADLAKACGTAALYKEFGERCLDCGICEDNMANVAAGLASYGFKPYIHSFAPFAIRRTLDQLYVSVSYAEQKIVVVGTDPGVWATANGGTHMSFEDVAAIRALPNFCIFEPTDATQLRQALPQILAYDKPVYLRLARKEVPDVFGENYKFDLLTADVMKEGKDLTILVTGSVSTTDCVEVAKQLENEGISVELINVHTVKPLDEKTILASAKKTGRVLTVENANKIGGLYGAVSELLSKTHPTLCDYVAIEDKVGAVGKMDELKKFYGITKENIYEKAKYLLNK